MKLIAAVLGMTVLASACVTREVQKETVVETRPKEVHVVPAPAAPARETTVIVPAR